MLLKDLISDLHISATKGDLDIDISGVAYDSRQARAGDLFIAIPGFKVDGARFAAAAVKAGAAAMIAEKPIDDANAVQIIVPNARQSLALVANRFYDHPSRKLKVIGITGTNGKTTIGYLLEYILKEAGLKTGLIGTVETMVDGERRESKMTTPESLDLQRTFRDMIEAGVSHVVLEVSSHSLALDRVLGTEFDVGVFTNLTHDHLDFHKTMDEYFKAKVKLFSSLGKGSKHWALGVINVDDPYSDILKNLLKVRALTYGINKDAELMAKNIKYALSGMTFSLAAEQLAIDISTKLIGRANAYNVLASILAALALDIEIGAIIEAVRTFPGAPGRFERVECEAPFSVIVDFAHSPDSLQKLIETYRPLAKGKMILVFGCPGDRDREKRPIMGDIAVRLADHVIISTDDPHSEDPAKIAVEVEAGMKGKKHEKIIDRKEAIGKALSLAQKDDIVLIAGRGHEKYQDFNGRNVEIDDRAVVKEALRGFGS